MTRLIVELLCVKVCNHCQAVPDAIELKRSALKEIFIGSSKEALEQASQVAAVLAEAKDVKPLLWTECFKLGDITFLGIENIACRVAGAVFLATPDDESVIREQRVRTPRGVDRTVRCS